MQLGLYQKQSIELVMTTELRQAIGLLQYNTMDLLTFIREQAVENPLIELEESRVDFKLDAEFSHSGGGSRHYYGENHVDPIDYVPRDENQLLDFIMEQIHCLKISDDERRILKFIILNLDHDGYLSVSTSNIAAWLDVEEAAVEEALQRLHGMEPLGLGARSIPECLMIQATRRFPDDEEMHQVIEHHLGELADKRWKVIAKQLDMSLDDVNQIAGAIASLNPKPCAGLFNEQSEYMYPDITIDEEFGDYTVTLGDHYLPKISLNHDYMSLKNVNSHVSSFIKSNYQQYMWLINSIEQRRQTIMKIVDTIIQKQPDFLKYGFTHLQPMTMKDIAEAIDMHESTVSRATRNKVIRTPVGSFEMGQLFSAKLRQHDSAYASSAQVKLLLKQLIEEENPHQPLSDQKLANQLKAEKDITISRRTVAKYREELNILSSAKRKQVV